MDRFDIWFNKVMSVLSGLIALGWVFSMFYHWDNVAHRFLSVAIIVTGTLASYLLWKLKD